MPESGLSSACYRCGYDLRGIADEQPCPECGLLALRSRRASDELRDTSPRWLASISRGTTLILLAILVSFAWGALPLTPLWHLWENFWPKLYDTLRWPVLSTQASRELPGWLLASALVLAGVILLTRPEGHGPADRADGFQRAVLRFAAMLPLAGLLLLFAQADIAARAPLRVARDDPPPLEIAALVQGTIGGICLPLLLFFRLRNLAMRARRLDLAEHCGIVGMGASAAMLYIGGLIVLLSFPPMRWLGESWQRPSTEVWIVALTVGVVVGIFVIWGLMLLVGFAIAFRRAATSIGEQWRRDDRSTSAS